MRKQLDKQLEKIVVNKLYIILLAVSFGVGLRFLSNFNFDIDICVIVISILSACNYFSYKLYNASIIKSDLTVLANKAFGRNIQLQINFYLILIIFTMIIMWVAIGFTAAALRFQLMIPKERILQQVDDLYIIGRVSQLEAKNKVFRRDL